MQNYIPTAQLQEHADGLKETIKSYEKRLESGSEDLEADLKTEQWLLAARNRLVRIEADLAKNLEREEADKRKREQHQNAARLAELRELHKAACTELSNLVNDTARELEGALANVIAKRSKIFALGGEHNKLFQKSFKRRPEVLEKLGQRGLVPGEGEPIQDSSRLYGHASLALLLAVNDVEGGPLSLTMALAAIGGATGSAYQGSAESPSAATPKPFDENGLTPGQIMARRRQRSPSWE